MVLNGCQRENSIEETGVPLLDPQVTVFSGVVGQISDESGNPIGDASVYLGDYQTSSNELGVFEFENILIAEDGAYVEVEKEGFFHGSRTFSTEVEETPYVKIELLGKDEFEILSTSQGGTIEVKGAEVNLPSGEYQLGDGTKYTGDIIAYAKYLDPTLAATYQQMPGSLTGIDLEGEEKVLGSYGMLGVELTNLSGEDLGLPEGTEAEIKFPIPSTLLGSAPGIIPLWHFDDRHGKWIEEGEAILVGNSYIAKVGHFSFWNCDVPFDFVEISGYAQVSGSDYVGGQIKITDLSTGLFQYSFTGANGFFAGFVPKDRDLLLEVISLCGEVVYEEQLGSLSSDQNLGIVNAPSLNGMVTITGLLDNCLGQEIESGYVVINGQGINLVVPVEEDGSFLVEVPACDSPTLVEIYGVDTGLGFYSNSEMSLLEDLIDVYILACEDYYESGYEIVYEGQNWASENMSDGLWLDIDIIEIPSGPDIEFTFSLTIIDSLVYVPSEGVQCKANFIINTGEEDVPYELIFESQGFRIQGLCDKEIENIGPFESLVFRDITNNIIIDDIDKFPGNVPEVSFVIRI